MAFHLIGTVWHLGATIGHAVSGNAPAAAEEGFKAVASLIPGGGLAANVVLGAMADQNIDLAAQVGNSVVNNAGDWIDNFGDGNGVAELSDIFDGLTNLFS